MRPGVDRAVGRTWILTLVMVVALMANITYLQGFEAQNLRDEPLNARQFEDRFKIDRGPIVADGERLAWSERTGDDRYQRRYKDGSVFAPITGYFSVFSQTGLEDAENHFLDARIPLTGAYAQSCNTTFAFMGAEEPGNDAVHEAAGRFGFGDRIEYADGLRSAPSSFPTTGEPSLSALGSIGQGNTVATPLQMAMVAAGIVNDGVVMKPRLVDKLRAPNGRTVDEISPARLSTALSGDQAKQLRDMMKAVVGRGTGKALRGTSVLGGKTGTADVEGAAYNDRWFIGFGPRDDPEYAVAVMTEAPGYGAESGPIAARIIDALDD
ncbi:MAG: penicillin-binding transpeptidase domain-containing protein [Spirillospora sp.]